MESVQLYQGSEGEQESSEAEEEDEQDEMDDGNNVEDGGGDEGEEGDGREEVEENEDDGDEQEGRRRYDLRNRSEVHKFSPEKEGKQRPRSPRRILHRVGSKTGKDIRKGGGSRVHKRHHLSKPDDSDDSLLVDEMDEGPTVPWARGASRNGAAWLSGGLDMHGATARGLNVAASGWGHQGDPLASLTPGVQTAGPSSKGGAAEVVAGERITTDSSRSPVGDEVGTAVRSPVDEVGVAGGHPRSLHRPLELISITSEPLPFAFIPSRKKEMSRSFVFFPI